MPYHLSGAKFYVARTKKGLIDQLRPTWNGLIKDLQAMEIKRLKAIVIHTRNEQIGRLMNIDKKQSAEPSNISDNTNTKNEVENDRTNDDAGCT